MRTNRYSIAQEHRWGDKEITDHLNQQISSFQQFRHRPGFNDIGGVELAVRWYWFRLSPVMQERWREWASREEEEDLREVRARVLLGITLAEDLRRSGSLLIPGETLAEAGVGSAVMLEHRPRCLLNQRVMTGRVTIVTLRGMRVAVVSCSCQRLKRGGEYGSFAHSLEQTFHVRLVQDHHLGFSGGWLIPVAQWRGTWWRNVGLEPVFANQFTQWFDLDQVLAVLRSRYKLRPCYGCGKRFDFEYEVSVCGIESVAAVCFSHEYVSGYSSRTTHVYRCESCRDIHETALIVSQVKAHCKEMLKAEREEREALREARRAVHRARRA